MGTCPLSRGLDIIFWEIQLMRELRMINVVMKKRPTPYSALGNTYPLRIPDKK